MNGGNWGTGTGGDLPVRCRTCSSRKPTVFSSLRASSSSEASVTPRSEASTRVSSLASSHSWRCFALREPRASIAAERQTWGGRGWALGDRLDGWLEDGAHLTVPKHARQQTEGGPSPANCFGLRWRPAAGCLGAPEVRGEGDIGGGEVASRAQPCADKSEQAGDDAEPETSLLLESWKQEAWFRKRSKAENALSHRQHWCWRREAL